MSWTFDDNMARNLSSEHKKTDELPRWFIVGFSGHRHLSDPGKLRELLREVFKKVGYPDRRVACVASAACGGDTIFHEEAARHSFPRFVLLPFDRDTFQKDFDTEQWTRAAALIDSAIGCDVLSGELARSEAFLDAGVLTVDRCDLLVVCWHGQAATGGGGTADVVAYAREVGKPMAIIDDVSGNLTFERADLLPGGDAVCVAAPIGDPLLIVQTEHRRQADKAGKHGPRSRNLVLWLIWLHLGASAIAVVVVLAEVNEAWKWGASLAKLLALCTAVVFMQIQHRAKTSWISSRLSTELCRSYLAIWKLRRSSSIVPDTEGMKLDSMAQSLRMLWYLDKDKQVTLSQAKEWYLRERIDNQRDYFQSSIARVAPQYVWGRRIALYGTVLTIISIALCQIIPHQLEAEWYYKLLKSMTMLLPLAGAAILSYLFALDMGRRTIRYREMIDALITAHKKVETAKTWPALLRVVADTERKLLREISEWHAVASYGGKSN